MPEPNDTAGGRFLGVRLTSEEAALLERLRSDRNLKSRSAAVRQLLREASASRGDGPELPVTRRRELEELVEDGYFTSVSAALESALEAGLRDLVANHREGLDELRRRARELRARGDRRRRADREGRGLLGR